MAKTLIAFYSRRGENWVDGGVRFLPKGNNEVIVEKIKAQLPEADVFRIETVKKYSDDYMVCIEEAKQELRAKARPELTAKVENMDQYDTLSQKNIACMEARVLELCHQVWVLRLLDSRDLYLVHHFTG